MFKAEPMVTRVAFVASDRPEAQEARSRLEAAKERESHEQS